MREPAAVCIGWKATDVDGKVGAFEVGFGLFGWGDNPLVDALKIVVGLVHHGLRKRSHKYLSNCSQSNASMTTEMR